MTKVYAVPPSPSYHPRIQALQDRNKGTRNYPTYSLVEKHGSLHGHVKITTPPKRDTM